MIAVLNAEYSVPAPKIAKASESRTSASNRETTVRNERTPMLLRLFDTQASAPA